jgi:hypothetical protein
LKNPKKRKRSPSATSFISQVTAIGGMTLRSRHKRLRGNEEDNVSITEEPQEDLTYNPDAANSNGASYIRYEIIEKKGKQFVVPVRYSIRRLR